MADLDRKELPGHQVRSQPGVSAWIAVSVGVALVGAGVLLGLYLAGKVPRVGKPRAAPVLVLPFAVVVALLGLSLLASEVARRLRAARARRLGLAGVGQPWLADHRWDPRGAQDDTFRRALRNLAGALLIGLFLVPFNWLAFGPGGELPAMGRVFFGLVTGLFDVLVVGLFGYGLYLLARRATYGSSFLRFQSFPFLMGRPMAANLRLGRRVPGDRPLVATLRCVEESWENRGSESASTVCYQLYADSRAIAPPFARTGEGWEASLGFKLPELPIGTRLAARPPRYWELEVRSEGPGVDYAATFLVPVYEQPSTRA
jgi:hypothetical protein